MHIVDYKHIHGTEQRPGYIAIPELDRVRPSARQFIELADLSIELDRPTAFLYVDGFTISQADTGLSRTCSGKYTPALKTGSSFVAHEWLQTFQNQEFVSHMNIIASTCAAGIQAVWEAQRLFDAKLVEDVIIIGGERTTDDTLRLFKELGISITCGDGFFFMHLRDSNDEDIHSPKWMYHHSQNPFHFTRESINKIKPLPGSVDYVKVHGTGTASNEEAEHDLYQYGKVLKYKPQIGHTQGVSALLETCMVLADDDIQGRILITANGLGGFFGAFMLCK